jgi:moderate conductance mechanosensitive channel
MIFANIFSGFFDNVVVQILLTVIAVLIVQIIVQKVLARIVRQIIKEHKYASKAEERKREDTLIRIFHTLCAVAIWVIAIVVILSELHVNIAALLTGAGLIGIIVGMGAQNVVKDYLAGILIITENQYRVGDIVMLNASGTNVAGVVEDVSIRATRLRDLDGNLHIVPNGSAVVITNMSLEFAQVNVDVGISYDSDIDKVEKIINEVGSGMAKDEPWSENIIEPIQFMRLDRFGDSSIVVKSVGKVKPATQWDTAGEFRRRVKKAFEKHGIEIPFPQVVIHQPANK